MADEQEQSQKTEEPTQKRRDDAIKKGQVTTSREVSSFFLLLALAFFLIVLAPDIMTDIKYRLSHFMWQPHQISLDASSFRQEMGDLMLDMLIIMTVPILAFVSSIFLANLVQGRFIFSVEPIIPKWNKISPMKGLKRIFSRKNFVEFLKGLFKICIVGAVATIAIWPSLEGMRMLPNGETSTLLTFIASTTGRMMTGVCIIMFIIAALDFSYQKFEYLQNLRMTKQEVKDEYKQQEGDPIIKQRLRQLRRERLQKQMMAAVPEADVVITNPTHYAVALKYDALTMEAPMVIAKGKDKVALRIRESAEKHKIIIMRNPPLARLLFDNAKMDEIIPAEYYQAAAEVISYVYQLKGINLPGSGGPAGNNPQTLKP